MKHCYVSCVGRYRLLKFCCPAHKVNGHSGFWNARTRAIVRVLMKKKSIASHFFCRFEVLTSIRNVSLLFIMQLLTATRAGAVSWTLNLITWLTSLSHNSVSILLRKILNRYLCRNDSSIDPCQKVKIYNNHHLGWLFWLISHIEA